MWDTDKLATLKTISVQGRPDGILFDPATQHVLILSHSAPNATVIDTKDGSLVGTIDAVKNGKIDPATIDKTLKADQVLTLENVDLSAAQPFAAAALGPDGKLAGIAGGKVAVNMNGKVDDQVLETLAAEEGP